MAFLATGSASSSLFVKDIDNMMPFSMASPWNFASTSDTFKRTTRPLVTGTSVLGIAFDGGVMICADTLGSYGSLARFTNCQRVLKVNDQIILGAGGDVADFQFVSSMIERQVIEEECLNDGFNLKPKSLHCWLTRTLYNRRSKFDPLWNDFVVGGMQDGKPHDCAFFIGSNVLEACSFLGFVDKIGTSFESPTIATGYGAYLAQPILRDAIEKKPDMCENEARDLLKHCVRILYYRDARSFPKYTLGLVTKEGVRIDTPLEIDSDWTVGKHIICS